MQTWAKRGLQTALVTGGLLMLGTGIASAEESAANPDSPAGPLDLGVDVPVQIDENKIGTPLGEIDVPGFEGELSTDPVLKPLGAATQSAAAATQTVKASEPAGQARAKQNGTSGGGFTQTEDAFKGNKVDGDVTVPIQICGNAVGVGGDAQVDGASCDQSVSSHEDTTTDGTHSGLAGNVVALDWAAPIQLAGNGVGLAGGSGAVTGTTASQDVTETGNISTNGTGSGLSGNVVSGQLATPVQVTGNAASWILANAYSEAEAETEAESGGWIKTNGDGAGGSGNVGAVPIALPLRFNGNAAAVHGSDADSVASSEADAEAGTATTPGINDIESFVQTGGGVSTLSGNIIQPQLAGTGNIAGVAGTWVGNATTGNALGEGEAGTSTSEVAAGGFSSTAGQKSAGSANIVDAPIGLPVEACGIGGTYIGNAHAAHDCSNDTQTGGGTYTNGDESFLGGNGAHAPLAVAPELFGIAGSHIGNASASSHEEKNVEVGGYNGTSGNDSSGGGNLVETPIAAPVEVFGIGGTYIGQAVAGEDGGVTEKKRIKAGDDSSTVDDGAFGAANLVSVPLAVPAQVFGVGGSHIGTGIGEATNDTITEAGGDLSASGKEGGASGNIATAPVALPLQAHGVGGSFIGIGKGSADNLTDAIAGGSTLTDGQDGAVAGNIIEAPLAGAGVLYNSSAGLAALVSGTGTNDVVAEAGGDATTNGDGGGLAGNVVAAQMLPIAQVFGDAVAAAAKATGEGVNATDVTSGGDITTSGVEGGFSGNIFDVPAAAVAQVFGNAIAAGGVADAVGHNVTTGQAGGTTTTSPTSLGSLAGVDLQAPVGAVAQIWDVPLALLGSATTEASNLTDITVDSQEPQINLPISGSELPATGLPTLPVGGAAAARSDAGLPATSLPELPGLPAGGELVNLPGLPGAQEQRSLPQVSMLPVQTLPAKLMPQADLQGVPSLREADLAPQADVPAIAQLDSLRTILGG
ncbi:beta strand repeat-containing protein [Amycolatopsis aidingensis]|uniref:beta strand repeat-containing protein n=1 Tax=Amycolatopsis aidingensis TaxID=2842453 RepID=UPI001C0C7C6E|nr:PE-PGRS family protein [Amycolatopsis aidingensis]